MTGIAVQGKLDPNVAWDGHRLCEDRDFRPGSPPPIGMRGAATSVLGDGAGSWRIVRDPLGINKLFWLRDDLGNLVMAARPRRLIDLGRPFADIQAFPSGMVVDLQEGGPSPVELSITPPAWFATDGTLDRAPDVVASEIRATVTGYLAALSSSARPPDVFVCLSGGLDSSGVAALAREVFPTMVAVSFDLKRPGGSSSDDRREGARVARDLGVPLLEATVTHDELLDHLDMVLVEGVDWRDFNVHAALVNAVLAQAIASATEAGGSAIVLTGDLSNEFLVDYEPESHKGAAYYRLPRLRPIALRASLVRGLDTCHREIGVFAAFGLRVVQPYAVASDAYLSLSEEFLRQENRKQVLSRAIFGALIPDHTYRRKKVRAQMGSAIGGGVLAACLDRGIDQDWLRHRFCKLHEIDDVSELDRFMRAGRYRSLVPVIEEV